MVTLTLSRAVGVWTCRVFDSTGEEYARTHANSATAALTLAEPYVLVLAMEYGEEAA